MSAVLWDYRPGGTGNEILDCDGFCISYNPAPCAGLSFFAADEDSEETAIVVGDDFFILNGDFREDYARLATFEGLDACLRFFTSKPDLVSSWSKSVEAALVRIGGAA